MSNSDSPRKISTIVIVSGCLLLAATGLATPAQACLDCLVVSNIGASGDDGVASGPVDPAALDSAMGALPDPTPPLALPTGPQPNQAGPQPEPPTAPALTDSAKPPMPATLLLPAVQAAREAARRPPVGQTRLPAVQLPQASTGPANTQSKHLATIVHDSIRASD